MRKDEKHAHHHESLPAADIDLLRSNLYALKDEIAAAVELLYNYRSCLPLPESRTASDIVGTFGGVFNAISLAMTNSGSEWLDWGISSDRRSLTHAEFCSLDPASIRGFADRIHHICEVLDIERDPMVKETWSMQMIQDHRRHMLVEESQLYELQTVAGVLRALLMPSRS